MNKVSAFESLVSEIFQENLRSFKSSQKHFQLKRMGSFSVAVQQPDCDAVVRGIATAIRSLGIFKKCIFRSHMGVTRRGRALGSNL